MSARRLLIIVVLLLPLFPVAAAAKITLHLPDDIMAEAQSPSGAVVTYEASATNPAGKPVPITCTPPSGSTFPIGVTIVLCTTGDGGDSGQSGTFTVTVQDTTPPSISGLSQRTVEAVDASGAVVQYAQPTAADLVDGSVPVTCSPASGSTFPLGTTTVICSATDSRGNKATGTFRVLVQDTTPPTLTQPAEVEVQASTPSGAVVNYPLPQGKDAVDPAPVVTCTPPPGTLFAVGETKVSCTARDASGNASQPVTFLVKVLAPPPSQPPPTPADTTPPVFSATANVVREANGPDGSTVNYALPTAVDAVDGPVRVVCNPPPGTRFPLGRTTVVCNAKDSRGNASSTTFEVRVVDTTPPVLTVPAPITVGPAAAGLPTSDPAIVSFLASARATDIVTPSPTITTDAPAFFPPGTTQVTFTAVDAAGNTTSGTSTVTIVASAVAQPPARDTTPPGDVTGVKVTTGPKLVTIRWKLAPDSDLDHVVVMRSLSTAGAGEAPAQVYSGKGTILRDRGVRNGVEYRYVIASFDRAGNRSAGVAVIAQPRALLLFSPADGASVRTAPMLVWAKVAGASYYNVQVYRLGKVLSAWPVRPQLKLRKTWKYDGRRRTLSPGLYRWFVWPGFGSRGAAKYGALLGQSTFRVVRGK